MTGVTALPDTDTTETETERALRRDKNAAYSAAITTLRENHRPEFNDLLKKEMSKRGLDWTPKPTAEERALAQIEEILAEHPTLRSRLLLGTE